MVEHIFKAYENAKQDIDRWYRNVVRDQIPENKRNDAIECIYYIGKANTLALILQSDFGEDTKEERESMRKIKDYLQYEVLENMFSKGKIYIVECNNPECWEEPQVYTDGMKAIEDIKEEYKAQLEELMGYSSVNDYWMIDEKKCCGNCMIERETDGNQWQWRITEHKI